MKKEKQVKAYQRRTKSGKTVTVRAHTAKYDASDKVKEAAKKEGAGKEFEKRQFSAKELKQVNDILNENKELDAEYLSAFYPEVSEKVRNAVMKEYNKNKSKSEKPRSTRKNTNVSEPKEETTKSKTTASKSTSATPAFTAAEFKEWYNGTGSAADKKVAKALRAQLGRSGYKKLEDEAIDNYTSRGHLKMFKRVSSGSESSTSTKSSVKAASKSEFPKVGESVTLSNWLDGSKGKKQSYQVVAVQNAAKQDKQNSGLQHWLWVKDKKGNIYAATHEEDGKIGIDPTWQDFTDSKTHPYSSSLKKAGYGLRKASGKGGEYWEVVTSTPPKGGSNESTRTKTAASKPTSKESKISGKADKKLPSIKGLFKKGSDYSTGYNNVTDQFLKDKVFARIKKAGFDYVATRSKPGGDSTQNRIHKFKNSKGDVVYVTQSHYGPGFDSSGRELPYNTSGNVDVIRGNQGEKWWNNMK